jgi:CheY-like chemotaxis protein
MTEVADPHAHVVLVVDDDDDARQGLVFYLESLGFAVRDAASGPAALQLLRDGLRPCALVVDVVMPDMDGWQLVARVRANPRFAAVPVVMLSAAVEDRERVAGLGIGAYLAKPTSPDAVASAVARHCPHRPS